MRPYRFKMRLSSRRLNVTRLGKGPAAAVRTAARLSLGSASSIGLMGAPPGIRTIWSRRPAAAARAPSAAALKFLRGGFSASPKAPVTGSLAEIIILPHFRPATALLGCDKWILRWPGPFVRDSSAPSPPGRRDRACSQDSLSPYWANESWSFFLLGGVMRAVPREARAITGSARA